MLVDEMAVNKKTVYAEFGSKQYLYHAALDRYLSIVVPERFAGLSGADADLSEVFIILDRFADAADRKGPRRGCFLCNASLELANEDGAVKKLAQRYFAAIGAAFSHALLSSRNAGQLPEEFDVNVWSSFLTTIAVGMFAMIRAGADGDTLRVTTEFAKSQLSTAHSDQWPAS